MNKQGHVTRVISLEVEVSCPHCFNRTAVTFFERSIANDCRDYYVCDNDSCEKYFSVPNPASTFARKLAIGANNESINDQIHAAS